MATKLRFKIVEVRDLPMCEVMPLGIHPTLQRYVVHVSPILRRRYTVRVAGAAEPGVYEVRMVALDGNHVVSDEKFGVTPDITHDMRAEVHITAPAWSEFALTLHAIARGFAQQTVHVPTIEAPEHAPAPEPEPEPDLAAEATSSEPDAEPTCDADAAPASDAAQ